VTTADTTITEAPDEKVARTPKGQMVPTCSPNDLRPLLTALASFGGPISKPILAKQVGTTITSSAYKSKLGTAGYYGSSHGTATRSRSRRGARPSSPMTPRAHSRRRRKA